MVQIIYGDVLLLIDFCMNFFVLFTTGVLLRRKTKVWCIAGASVIGSIYSVAKVFVNGNDVFDCVISLGVGILMCYITFGGCRFLKTVLVFFGTAALVGGVMFSVYFLLGSYHRDIFGNIRGYAYSHIPLWLFVLLAAISFLLSWIFSYLGRETTEKKEVTVMVEHQGNTVEINLLMDSGNLVKEPISGKNAILLCGDKAKALLPGDMYAAILNGESERLLKNHFRLLCASGIDGKMKTYYGFLPDRITWKDEKYHTELDAYIVICEPEVKFCGNDGIAHPALFV